LGKNSHDGPIIFKNVFCALPSRKRKVITYSLNWMLASRSRQTIQAIGLAIVVPIILVFVALAGVLTAVSFLWVRMHAFIHSLVGLMMTPEMRERQADVSRDKLFDLLNDPESVRFRTLARQIEAQEELDFYDFQRAWRNYANEKD
jgi:hypothetical protein